MQSDARADEAVLVSTQTDADKCVVCLDPLYSKEPSVTCDACFARSKNTWRSHIHCWNSWELQTCFFCKKHLVRFSNNKKRRALRRRRLKRLHYLTDCVMAIIITMFFTAVLSLFFLFYASIATFVLRNDSDRAIFFNAVVVSLVLLARSFKREHFNVFVRAEFRTRFRVRRMLALAN
jgi:hypothetical protein